MDELRTVFPKFDLGKPSRQIDRPLRTVYATIDRNGEQTALSTPSRFNAGGIWKAAAETIVEEARQLL